MVDKGCGIFENFGHWSGAFVRCSQKNDPGTFWNFSDSPKSDYMILKKEIQVVDWGVDLLDQSTGGLPQGEMSILETPDFHSGMLVLGHYLYSGLKNGEKCVLVTSDSAKSFLENFLMWEMNFEQHIENEKLIILNYVPNFGYELGLTHHYDNVFNEISRLSTEQPARIAIQQIDSMVNLNNITMMNGSTQKLSDAIKSPVFANTTVLGQFVQFNDEIHRNLRVCFQKAMTAFFTLEKDQAGSQNFDYKFMTNKLPWYGYVHSAVPLTIKEGRGFLHREDHSGQAA